MTDVSFASLGLAEPLLRAIADTGYSDPTPIQIQAIPMVIRGGDLLAAAQTGTGKTASFALPLLQRLSDKPLASRHPGRPRCLILAPTRELSAQVEQAIRVYGKHLSLSSMVIFGGVSIGPQIERLKQPLDVLVATPGRLLDHAGQGTIDLGGVEILVLDEADRMLDMGFIRDIRKILKLLPEERQNLLFSATFSDEIRELASGLLHEPGSIEVAPRNTTSELVAQAVYPIEQRHKRELLAHLIKSQQWFQVLVFTRTKHGANKLAEYLARQDISAMAIHGNKSQSARTRALAQFKDCKLQVLVATDIAARGLDIDQLPHVVNFDLPNVAEDYVHRIGRTGRAGSSGEAISLVDGEEAKHLAAIERLTRQSIERRVPPADFVPSEQGADPASEPRQPLAPRPARQRPGGEREQPRQRADKPARPNEARRGGRRTPAESNGTRQPVDPRAPADPYRTLLELEEEEVEAINFNRMDIDPTGRRVRERPEVDGNRMPARNKPEEQHGGGRAKRNPPAQGKRHGDAPAGSGAGQPRSRNRRRRKPAGGGQPGNKAGPRGD